MNKKINNFSENKPLVSVIMPAYNAEKYISEAIESILNQTFKDFEFIILDDASTDNTGEIIREYADKDQRIVSVKNEKNLYIAGNRNKGISLARGKYIVWQDADDISKSHRIYELVKKMESDKNVGICGSYIGLFNEKGIQDVRTYPSSDFKIRSAIFKFSPVAQPAAIVRKAVLDDVGCFDPDYPPAEDLELSFRIGVKYKFANIPEVLILYRLHGESATYKNMKTIVKNTIKARMRFIDNPSYRSNISDYISILLTWLVQFIPVHVTIKVFEVLRKLFI